MKQVIVITGLAHGMGLETARMLGKEGHAVAGFDMDAEGVGSLREELDSAGVDNLLESIDITDRKEVLLYRDRVLGRFGHVDTVLSNAGIGFFGPFEEVDLDSALRCMEINVIGAAAIFQAFLPSMRQRGKGKLVAVSSLVGQIPFPFESIYSASKFAVEGLVNSLKYEVEPFGIRVALIQPSQVSTKFAEKSQTLPPEDSPYSERVRRFIEKDDELIKHAPTPQQAAREIVKVINSKKPKLNNQVEFKSSAFILLNRVLPTRVRDEILLNHMGIKE